MRRRYFLLLGMRRNRTSPMTLTKGDQTMRKLTQAQLIAALDPAWNIYVAEKALEYVRFVKEPK
jgi:hypothetical protein